MCRARTRREIIYESKEQQPLRKFFIRVFGCQMNSYDGDRLRSAMNHMGWTESVEEEADVVMLVTWIFSLFSKKTDK